MTQTSPLPTIDAVLREAQRAWFRCGVRRRDRRLLRDELRAELGAAADDATDLFGPDPRTTAVAWAREQGLADRRLRLAAFLLPALAAGVVAAGGVLMMLADAFSGTGAKAIGDPGAVAILSVYVVSSVLSAAAVLVTTWLILRAWGDTTATLTVRVLAVALPVGGLTAAAVGITVAGTRHFTTTATTFVEVGAGVVVVLVVTMVVARSAAVRLSLRATGGSERR